MQYNKPNNLLQRDHEGSLLAELPEHHLPRPVIADRTNNVNKLSSTRHTRDSSLFMTVASVQSSPNGRALYLAGSDCKVQAYSFDVGVDRATCRYKLDRAASRDLLNTGLVATACHQTTDGSFGVYNEEMRSSHCLRAVTILKSNVRSTLQPLDRVRLLHACSTP